MISCYQLTIPDPIESTSNLFEDVSFDIESGEWVRFSGPSGSGKSVLFRLCSLQSLPQKGNLIVAGRHVERLNPERLAELRTQIGSCRESIRLMPEQTVVENLSKPLMVRDSRDSKWGKPERLLEQVDRGPIGDVPGRWLSRGDRRLVGILRALIGRPELLLIDGGFRGLSKECEQPVRQLVRTAHEDGSTVVLFTRHDTDADHRCQAEYELHDGRLERFRLGEEDRGIFDH